MPSDAPPRSTVYGPVRSWRAGNSLGIDLLFRTSICSFRCVYCQLGKIEEHTGARKVYVPTTQVVADLAAVPAKTWSEVDVVTFSGNGEPTLAANLGACIGAVKAMVDKPVMVLTNAVHLGNPEVRADLALADRVFLKLDAPDDATLERVNHPVPGVTVASILEGIHAFKAEYRGHLAVQSMFMPLNMGQVEAFARLLSAIDPAEVQLNTPLRPVPREWVFEARGNHGPASYPTVPLRTLTRAEARTLEHQLAELTGLRITSVYKEEMAAR